MNQYQNQYGTIFAVKEHNGAPAIMCRAELSETWSLSSMIEPFTPGAWTVEELQAQLDNWAAVKGWQPVEESASVEVPLPRPGDVYRSPKSGQLYKIGELANGKKTCYLTMRSNAQGGTWVPVNSSVYPKLSDAQGEFEAWIRTEQLEPVAPTGAAAATTGESAAPEPPRAAETTTTSESGADAGTSMSQESGTSGPSTLPARGCPAGTGDAAQGNSESAPLATPPSGSSAFDYTGLDAQTVADLHLAEREFAAGRRLAEIGLRRMADGVAIAHDALCGACDNLSQAHNNQYSEKTFGRWCESVGLNRKAAERLLQVSKLFDASTPREQRVLEELGPSLLYVAAKPSAPAELVQAVKDGDITTHKQYQALLAQYNAERAARERAEHEAAMDRKEQEDANAAALRYKSECDRRAQDQQRLEGLISTAQRDRDAALHRAAEAEKQRDGAREAARAAEAENDEMRRKLQQAETRPIEVAVAQPGEAQIEAWRQEGADRCAAALQDAVQKAHKGMVEAQNHAADLEDQLAQARPDADACQRTVDTIFETIESLRGLLRTQLRAAQLTPAVYGGVVGHLLQVAQNLQNTVRDCAPAGYTMNDDEEDFL